MTNVWGYKKNGEACLFDLAEGAVLPPGWSLDYKIIELDHMRTAEAITESAGVSAVHPVKVEHAESKPQAAEPRTFPDTFSRGPGRPPLSKDKI